MSPALSSPSPEERPGSRDAVPFPGMGRASEAAIVQFSLRQGLAQLSLCPHQASLVSVPSRCAPASAALLHPGLCLEPPLGPRDCQAPTAATEREAGTNACYLHGPLLSFDYITLRLFFYTNQSLSNSFGACAGSSPYPIPKLNLGFLSNLVFFPA